MAGMVNPAVRVTGVSINTAAVKDRSIVAADVRLPAGTEVFSADDHISLSEDIFYERFPQKLRDRAPRVLNEDGAYTLAVGGQTILPKAFTDVLQASIKYKTDMRTAAYIVAINRVATVTRMRGMYA